LEFSLSTCRATITFHASLQAGGNVQKDAWRGKAAKDKCPRSVNALHARLKSIHRLNETSTCSGPFRKRIPLHGLLALNSASNNCDQSSPREDVSARLRTVQFHKTGFFTYPIKEFTMPRAKKTAKKAKKVAAPKFTFIFDGDDELAQFGTLKQIMEDAKDNVVENFDDGTDEIIVYELVPRYKVTRAEVTVTKL